MLHTTPQERLALGVVSLLLAAGAGARWLSAGDEPAGWVDSAVAAADTLTGHPSGPPVAAAERELARERIRSRPLEPGERIDPNLASLEELERLPRVGPSLAARIVEHRELHGPLRSLADLDAVTGVGPAMLRSLEPHLVLPPAPPGGTASSAAAGRMELNRATAAELESLPGVGPALAARIVAWRSTHGPFRSLAELEEVPGIGPVLRARLEPRLRVGR